MKPISKGFWFFGIIHSSQEEIIAVAEKINSLARGWPINSISLDKPLEGGVSSNGRRDSFSAPLFGFIL
jgi:hypothetical protein